MAIGDQADILGRLEDALPPWFGDDTPIIDAVLAGLAAALAFIYALYAYAVAQTRILTATGIWLDLIAYDFFGTDIQRNAGESDAAFRTRIRADLFQPRATRKSVSDAVEAITGVAPVIIEPFSPKDCGAYGIAGTGYGVAGYYGSMGTPAQAFLISEPPSGQGLGNIGGYRAGPWGYGVGNGCYTTPTSIATLDAIYDAIARTKAEGVVVWVALTGVNNTPRITTETGNVLETESGLALTI